MKRIVFLASGGGGNLIFLYHAMKLYLSQDFAVIGVIADRGCRALELGKKLELHSIRISYSREYSSELVQALRQLQPDYIVTNIHKVLDVGTVRQYTGRLINLHYSMLPDFGGVIGTKPVELALAAGRRTIGTTVHHVTENVDCGPIISQSEIPVRQNEDFQDLMNRVFRAGCLNLFNAFRVLEGASTCVNSGRNYDDLLLSPWVITGDGWFSGEFWGTLKSQNDL